MGVEEQLGAVAVAVAVQYLHQVRAWAFGGLAVGRDPCQGDLAREPDGA